MENISGHLVRERVKIVAFPDGLNPGQDDLGASQPDDSVAKAEEASSLLGSVFADDDQAKEIFVLRAKGFRPSEIQERLRIGVQAYETINRRILRRISQFAKQSKYQTL